MAIHRGMPPNRVRPLQLNMRISASEGAMFRDLFKTAGRAAIAPNAPKLVRKRKPTDAPTSSVENARCGCTSPSAMALVMH